MNEYDNINELNNQNTCRICNVKSNNVHPMSTNQIKHYQSIVVRLLLFYNFVVFAIIIWHILHHNLIKKLLFSHIVLPQHLPNS